MELSDKSVEELANELNQIPFFGDLHPRALLKRVPFFADVPDDVLDGISQKTILRNFGPDESICRQGEYEDNFYLILRGKVEVSIRTRENPHISLATLSKNDFFGELGPLSGGPRTATITAIERTLLLEIPKESFLYLHKSAESIRERIDEVYLKRSLTTHLRRISIFSDLPDDILDKFREKVKLIEFERGDPILRKGEPGDSLYLIRSGFVKVGIGEGEDERIFAYLKDGNYFGEMSLLKGGERSANVTAVTRVEAVKMDADHFQALLKEYPDVRKQIEKTIAAREAETEEIKSNDDKAKAMKFVVDLGIVQAAKILVIDLKKCVRCHCCVRACALTHEGYASLERRGHRYGHILLPTTCMHCTDPECMLCPHGGIYRDKDGEIHHTVQCIHCGLCAKRCPYGNILLVEPEVDKREYRGFGEQIRDFLAGKKATDEEEPASKKHVVKCDMCANQPFIACVYNCPVNACNLITPEELLAMSSK